MASRTRLTDEQKALRIEITRCQRQGPLTNKVRTIRHWKQQFDKGARFVWRKPTKWDGNTSFEAGSEVPKGLLPPTKLRRFWEAGRIELAEFDEPKNVFLGRNEPKKRTVKKPAAKKPVTRPPADKETVVKKPEPKKPEAKKVDVDNLDL